VLNFQQLIHQRWLNIRVSGPEETRVTVKRNTL